MYHIINIYTGTPESPHINYLVLHILGIVVLDHGRHVPLHVEAVVFWIVVAYLKLHSL